MLPDTDQSFLQDRAIAHDVVSEGGMVCVLIRGWPLPPGYSTDRVDLLLRLQPGYPDVPPDMWWFDPPVHLENGAALPATEVTEHYVGRTWQRWSRHFGAGQWHSGVDGLESYLALIRRELGRLAGQAA